MKKIEISIIIPTYKDWNGLKLCLEALQNQSYSPEFFEIIVVNNDVNSKIPDDIFVPGNCKVILESKPGSYAARNSGLKISVGKIIGFTDSDCIPDKDWITNAIFYFEMHPDCKRIAGKIALFNKEQKPNLAEIYDKLYAFPQASYVKNLGSSVTANLFTFKEVFNIAGVFDEKMLSGADLRWGLMAQQAGAQIEYVENVIIHHPARNTFTELIKKEKRLGGGSGILFKKHRFQIVNFLRLLNHFRPRIAEMKYMLANGKSLKLNHKVSILLIRHYLLGIRAYEKFRVQMGKKPNRA